ncbi:MAG: LytR/AlgR family response regulator transcription factor [Desulfitobacteriaceae bacterium]
MVSVAIVEDDLLFQEELAKLLVSIPEIDLAGTFTNGEEFLSFVQEHRPQILFLDIGLPGISGIEVADRVRKDFPYMEIVFITADENHGRDAIRLYASDYISKPLDSNRLHETLTQIIRKPPVPEKKIELKCEEKIEILNQEDIYLVEAILKKTLVYTGTHILSCTQSLKEIAAQLDNTMFFRTTRSYLVNMRLVEAIKPCSRTSYQIYFMNKEYRAYLQKKLYPEFRERIKFLSGEGVSNYKPRTG